MSPAQRTTKLRSLLERHNRLYYVEAQPEISDADYDKLFRESLSVTLNPATGRFVVALKLYLVIQFRGALYDMAIAFEV